MIQRTMSELTAVSLALALLQTSLVVSGLHAGTASEESGASTVTPTSETESPAPATLKITRLLHRVSAEQLVRGRRMHVEGETMPAEYQTENSWLILKDAGTSDTAPLYRCDINSGQGSALSRRDSHPDMTSHTIVGYIYTKPGPGRVALRLVIPKGTPREGYFVTDFTNCEGAAYREEELLGYAYRTIPYDVATSVTPSTLEPGGTLNISWQTTYVPEGQQGRANKFPDRILGIALSPAVVSGAFIDEEGKITGEPKTDPFAKHVPLSGSYAWKSTHGLSGAYAQKLPPGEYQIQFALFPKCFYDPASPGGWQLDDILFTASNVFTVGTPVAPSNLAATCGSDGAVTFTWSAPSGFSPPSYSIRIQDTATGKTVDEKGNLTTTSYSTSLEPGHTYTWWVSSQFASGQSPCAAASSPLLCR